MVAVDDRMFAELRTIFLNYELGVKRNDPAMQLRALQRWDDYRFLASVGIAS